MRRFWTFLLISCAPFFLSSCSSVPQNPEKISTEAWHYYRDTFIKNGRVIRPQNNNDTVSEGQAYTMVRAVLMKDRKTFDECLAWSEKVLSRKNSDGDYLLAWHYRDGKVTDTTAASDADIDYAFSLIVASKIWQAPRYLELAKEVLASILEAETTRHQGRLYLLPWPANKNKPGDLLAQNLSYYAPSHFKLFYETTSDPRWLELVDTTYYLLGRLLHPGELPEGPIVPDWIAINDAGAFVHLPGKDVRYGWDAVRVPMRIAADYHLYGDKRAFEVLSWLAVSFEEEFRQQSKFLLQRDSTLQVRNNALFYSAMYASLEATESPSAPKLLQRIRKFIRQEKQGLFYNHPDDYYINSLCWITEYYEQNKKHLQARSKKVALPLQTHESTANTASLSLQAP
uniref:cellulase n=1 Tax=Chlorobium chlorochromatii (strain CaD3) TaxID=340177 RepID=Q3ATR3_CHLCH